MKVKLSITSLNVLNSCAISMLNNILIDINIIIPLFSNRNVLLFTTEIGRFGRWSKSAEDFNYKVLYLASIAVVLIYD